MDNLQITTIDLLRHGACEGGEIFRGSTDVPLTEAGWQQMRDALAAHSGWQRIVSSPLQRCRLFAEMLAEREALPLEVLDPLRELHFGDWEGRRIVDVQAEHGTSLRSFWSDPSAFTPPEGEPMTQFRERVLQAAADVLQRHRTADRARRGHPPVVVRLAADADDGLLQHRRTVCGAVADTDLLQGERRALAAVVHAPGRMTHAK
jgi:broad specificity phosphatase PhoE